MFDYLVVISELDRNKMLKAQTMPEKLKYIPNFVDINVFFEKNNLFKDSVKIHKYLKDGKPKIIYLAQLIKRKGHVYLFKALKIIRSKYPDVVLLLCGMGEYEKELRKEVKKMWLNDSVHFLGQVPHDYIPAILSHCDVSVVSSLSETFGWAIVEPLLAGTPIVSTLVGIAPEVENAGGLLGVPVADADSLAKAVIRLIEDHSLRKDTVERGIDYVKRHLDIHTVTMKYEELYNS
jgi:glycosyltransferase involved in cell wall biosynthesis